MIYELRTYTLVPGKQAEYLKLSGDVGRKARGDKYGKLEGHWFTEFGTLNQVVHLWSYPDLNERERLRGELAKNEEWTKGYLPQPVGRAGEWLGHFKAIMPVREKYSKNVGLWQTEMGALNEVVHLWAYHDLNDRAAVRAKVMQDPEWQAFLGKATPILFEMKSIILNPSPHSPMK